MRAMRLDRATTSVRIPDAALDAIKNLGLGRDQVTLLIETMGIIVALSLGSAISADSAISFEQLIACDGWDKYRAPIVICFHFCLAQLIVFIVTLLAIGYVKDGDWFKFYTRAVLPHRALALARTDAPSPLYACICVCSMRARSGLALK